MAQSYYPAGAGQSGSVQSVGGAIAGLFGEDDELKARYYSDLINNKANSYARLLKPRDVRSAYEEFDTAYRANDGMARSNADFYSDLSKGILSDGTRTADTYERLRSGNLSSLGDVFKNVLDYGLSSQKARLAAGGYGGVGPSSYDRILSSTMTASNMAPVLNTIYGNLGRDASAATAGDRTWDSYRMGTMAQDPLTGYYDSVAGRSLVPLGEYRNLIDRDIGVMGNALNNVIIPNVAGYDLVPGLASRLNNLASGTMNLANFGSSLMSSYGGMMGGGAGGMGGMMGGMGGGGSVSTSGYPSGVGYSVPMQYAGNAGMSYGQPVQAPVNYAAVAPNISTTPAFYGSGMSY